MVNIELAARLGRALPPYSAPSGGKRDGRIGKRRGGRPSGDAQHFKPENISPLLKPYNCESAHVVADANPHPALIEVHAVETIP